MTFTDITNEVQDSLARSDTVVTGKIATWVNRALHESEGRYDFQYMLKTGATVTTVNGTQGYSLGDTVAVNGVSQSDFKSPSIIYLQTSTTFIELPLRAHRAMLLRFTDPTAKAQPEFASIQPGASTINFWKTPDAAYTIKPVYYAWSADLSGTQSNWLTNSYPDLLIEGAKARGMRLIGADDEAEVAQRLFEGHLLAAIVADGIRAPSELAFGFELDPRASDASLGDVERQLDDTA